MYIFGGLYRGFHDLSIMRKKRLISICITVTIIIHTVFWIHFCKWKSEEKLLDIYYIFGIFSYFTSKFMKWLYYTIKNPISTNFVSVFFFAKGFSDVKYMHNNQPFKIKYWQKKCTSSKKLWCRKVCFLGIVAGFLC